MPHVHVEEVENEAEHRRPNALTEAANAAEDALNGALKLAIRLQTNEGA